MNHSLVKMLPTLLLPVTVGCLGGTCDTGRFQSPINITSTQKQKLPKLEFDYRTSPLIVANDGHTLRVRIKPGSHLRIGNANFGLTQVHFHTPAGDQIADEPFPMGAHFVHKSAGGQLLALVVLFRLGEASSEFDTLLRNIPHQVGPNQTINNASINLNNMLPVHQGYYRYRGSLTAPPCTEGVEWIVLKEPVFISAEQLKNYKNFFSNNARAIQPHNNRLILESL